MFSKNFSVFSDSGKNFVSFRFRTPFELTASQKGYFQPLERSLSFIFEPLKQPSF